ncbi:GyrI-like domain-containing protein [Undibacterium sp. TJN19]|uniref:GyrI-like domain-containing protein n=1 Tax=Undibacterium sp. TJN19 TaxID=3413055 RepID=UPI003BF13FFF
MKTRILEVGRFQVSGLKVRTRNADETGNATAKIGPLWGLFFAQQLNEKMPGKTADSKVYGVYSNYEFDASGAFDVTAGMAVNQAADKASSDYSNVVIEPGSYLVFECEGELPKAVIDGWADVWSYFEKNPAQRRRFKTDFEEYRGPQQVAIYIGIE